MENKIKNKMKTMFKTIIYFVSVIIATEILIYIFPTSQQMKEEMIYYNHWVIRAFTWFYEKLKDFLY